VRRLAPFFFISDANLTLPFLASWRANGPQSISRSETIPYKMAKDRNAPPTFG